MNNLSGSLSFHGDVSGQMGANLIANVEANPSGTPTDILTSIRVGDVIYSIPSGGGGGGGGTNNYEDLLNKPKINNVILSGELSLSDLGIYNPVTMTGATSTEDGAAGYAPKPLITDKDKFLKGDGTWAEVAAGGDYEIINITPGNDTTSRTFTFTKQPKFIKIFYISPSLTFNYDTTIVWGQNYFNYLAHSNAVQVSGGSGALGAISYNDNQMTLTAANAFGACNNSDGSGYMFVIY